MLRYIKKSIFLLFIALFVFLFVCYAVPQKTTIQKTLICAEQNQTILVTISGTYYDYILKNDCFEGMIDIAGKQYTGTYPLRDDLYGNFVDEFGQPTYSFLQFKQFSYLSGSDGIHNFTSEWDSAWNEAYQKKVKWKQWTKAITLKKEFSID